MSATRTPWTMFLCLVLAGPTLDLVSTACGPLRCGTVRQRALLEGPFRRVPVQQLSLASPTNGSGAVFDIGKLQCRKFCMRRHKCFKAARRHGPTGVAQEAYAQQTPDQAAFVSRLEALAGLKVEYAWAYIAAEEPEADSGLMELLCMVSYKDYASITWTVNGRPLENFIDHSTLSTVKNDVSVKVSKITINQLGRLPSDNGKFVFECTALVNAQVTKTTIALCSIIEDTCTSNAHEGRCLCKPSQPVSLKSKHLTCCAAAVFTQPNAVCTDRLICDCTLEFVHYLDGKTCDKLHTTAENLIGQPCKVNIECHAAGAACLKDAVVLPVMAK
ncbi:hypothetical protein HPB49_012244 [Dermacentor silvarum]|uniref:Uncharacterized protein n=1 Tax=Dermacentor silvarum TaxID=543639 RepID=A0ACB8D5E3_DERSI|nr:hypothetical protein HPB49_012244 [Dermacentor silvarum]